MLRRRRGLNTIVIARALSRRCHRYEQAYYACLDRGAVWANTCTRVSDPHSDKRPIRPCALSSRRSRLPWSSGQPHEGHSRREARRELRNRGIDGGAGYFLNDLHRFDLLLRSWSDLSNQNVAGALPPARMSPGFAACDQGLYLYGGKEETGE